MENSILICEDEPIILMDLREILESNGFNVVATAKDGYDAIELFKIHNPNIMILDIKMPMIDGLKVAEIVSKENKDTGIIMLTAHCDKDTIEKANKANVISFLTKPISENALVAAVSVAINRQNNQVKTDQELFRVKEELKNRKIIDRAKGILMDKQNLTEGEAYSYLRKSAMDKGCTIGKISEIVIISNQ